MKQQTNQPEQGEQPTEAQETEYFLTNVRKAEGRELGKNCSNYLKEQGIIGSQFIVIKVYVI